MAVDTVGAGAVTLSAPAVGGVPPWVPSALAGSYNTATQVFGLTSTNSARHRAGLAAAKAGTGLSTQIVLGDSSADGWTGASYDRTHSWPMVYRSALAGAGMPSAGTGWVRAADTIATDVRWHFDTRWVNTTLFRYAQAAGAVATYTEPMAGTTVALRYATYAGASFAVSVDGATSGGGYRLVTTSAATNFETATLTGLSNAPHRVTVTTRTSALVAVFAASVTAATHGVVIDNLSQGGARASGTGVASWSDVTSAGGLGTAWGQAARYSPAPDTVWLALGGNDIHAGATPATTVAAVKAIVARFPQSDVFLVLEYQPNEVPVATWTAWAQALYQAAATLHLPLFDEWARMGNYSTYSAEGYAGDTIAHLDAAGYALLGNWLGTVAL